jgi:hypothetical protein
MPTLISISSGADHLAACAQRLHSDLANRYVSFIHNKNLEGVRLTFDHLARSNDIPTGHIKNQDGSTSAVLHSLYAVVREKRVLRREFITNAMTLFNVDEPSWKQVCNLFSLSGGVMMFLLGSKKAFDICALCRGEFGHIRL